MGGWGLCSYRGWGVHIGDGGVHIGGGVFMFFFLNIGVYRILINLRVIRS